MIIPKAPVERLIRRYGAERVADGAAVELTNVLEKIGSEIAIQANKLSRHAGRKTVKAGDIKLAAKR